MDTVLAVVQTLTLFALVVYVWKTWEMASAARQSSQVAERTLLELRDSRDQETRPYVVVDFDLPMAKGIIYLVVKNIGKTVARNVKITFTPPLQTSESDQSDRIMEVGFIKNGIPSLPPGHEVRTLVGGTVAYFGTTGIPLSYDVKISFLGGLLAEERTYSLTLDLSMYMNRLYIREAGMDELTEAVKELASHQAKTEQALTRVSNRLDDGLRIHSIDATVLPLDISMQNWTSAVSSKLREFALMWSSLLRREDNGRVAGILPPEIQRRARLASEQIISLAAKCPEPDSRQITGELMNIAEQLSEMGRIRIYADGGQSLDNLQRLGDEAARYMGQVVGLLTAEAVAPSFREDRDQKEPSVEATTVTDTPGASA